MPPTSEMRKLIIIATTKTSSGGFRAKGSRTSQIDGEFSALKRIGGDMVLDLKDERLETYYQQYLDGLIFQDYVPGRLSVKNAIFPHGSNMYHMADWAMGVSMSPIVPATGWAAAVQDAKEFTIYFQNGKLQRPALILPKEGRYAQVAVYASKDDREPLVVLDEDIYTPNVADTLPLAQGTVNVVRNMRVLEIAPDGSYVRMWASRATDCDNSDCWYPRALYDQIKSRFGPPPATSMAAGQDADLIIKCGQEQWKQAAQWQADCLLYLMEQEGVEVVFSHYHGPDMAGHTYMKYLKERPTSQVSEETVRQWAENTYQWTDEYIGRFLHCLDDGWTILLFSDHALICPEQEPNEIADNAGVNVGIMEELGYTVMQKDADGKPLPKIDWSKTRAVQTRANSIYINLKGREAHGIVDPADKYELEEQIITDLYSYRDKKNGKRIVSMALHNKDAVLLGMGGPYAADIIILVHEDYNYDHGESLSTACGHNDTSVGPIFVAAGPGIKAGHTISRYIREVDVAPTAAVLLGVDIPSHCEGAPSYEILSEKL